MSQQLINLNDELRRLRNEGYNVRVDPPFVIVEDIPYVAADRSIMTGFLVSDLQLSGDQINGMGSHVAHFAGAYPCDVNGNPLEKLRHGSGKTEHRPGLVTDHSFSSRPVGPEGQGQRPYTDYFEKMDTYVKMISSPAHSLDPSKDPRTFPTHATTEEESVFHYPDTASSRAGISAITARLEMPKVAIVGLGGTGSYVLDLVAKTPVKEIHLYDNDVFYNHNAFRAPGAASRDQLNGRPKKVEYFAEAYSRMRRGIHAHDLAIDDDSVAQLLEMNFVFLCLDSGPAKKVIVETLENHDIPFTDVGMGLYTDDNQKIYGALRTVSRAPASQGVESVIQHIPLTHGNAGDLYGSNIQVADLNCLNACMAVIQWKKIMGFYTDLNRNSFTAYHVEDNHIVNDAPCPAPTESATAS